MEDGLRVMLQALLGSTTSSMRVAATLAEHRGGAVSKVDMVAGLLYRLMTPMTDEELTQSLADGQNLERIVIEPVHGDSDETSEDEDEDAAPEPEKLDIGPRELSISTYSCNCTVCMQARVCIQNYKDFVPSDQSTALMHRGLQQSMTEHQVIIRSQ
jgi:hypothetical protein